jgi:hypothetical protein
MLARTGNRYLRYYLVEAANLVRRHEPEYHAFYQKKYREVQKHSHKRALVLTARKLVRLIDALLRNNQIYAPKKKFIDEVTFIDKLGLVGFQLFTIYWRLGLVHPFL